MCVCVRVRVCVCVPSAQKSLYFTVSPQRILIKPQGPTSFGMLFSAVNGKVSLKAVTVLCHERAAVHIHTTVQAGNLSHLSVPNASALYKSAGRVTATACVLSHGKYFWNALRLCLAHQKRCCIGASPGMKYTSHDCHNS